MRLAASSPPPRRAELSGPRAADVAYARHAWPRTLGRADALGGPYYHGRRH